MRGGKKRDWSIYMHSLILSLVFWRPLKEEISIALKKGNLGVHLKWHTRIIYSPFSIIWCLVQVPMHWLAGEKTVTVPSSLNLMQSDSFGVYIQGRIEFLSGKRILDHTDSSRFWWKHCMQSPSTKLHRSFSVITAPSGGLLCIAL